MILVNAIKHIGLVSRHKWKVFILCTKIGMPFRGAVHDLSKFSPTEFWESVKYYNGKKSPIIVSKEKNGYSKAWLHHKGRNKHHSEYWIDFNSKDSIPVIPYKYAAEMVCDRLSASLKYNGKEWKQNMPLDYWNKEKEQLLIHPYIQNFLTEVFQQVEKNGINKTLTKKNIKNLYNKNCIDVKDKYDVKS